MIKLSSKIMAPTEKISRACKKVDRHTIAEYHTLYRAIVDSFDGLT